MEEHAGIFAAFFICASVLITASIKSMKNNKRCTLEVTAEVVDYEEPWDEDSDLFKAKCTYTYAGYTYTGHTEWYHSLEEIKARYPIGSKTILYINPQDPGKSIPLPADLENQTANGFLGFMIVVVIIGILLMLGQV